MSQAPSEAAELTFMIGARRPNLVTITFSCPTQEIGVSPAEARAMAAALLNAAQHAEPAESEAKQETPCGG